MHYPFWYVPWMTSPMWIAVVAVLHMFAAMYAVGGGILLTLLLRRAYNDDGRQMAEVREDYIGYLRQHAWFFVLLTVVFGAITGLGIWWTIGLASPFATEELIHIFVFVWALEYVAFIVEIVAAFTFFYYWGRLDRKTHLIMVGIYGVAAWISLALITPITAFQINNGGWQPGDGVWAAFWNPQAIPQIVARTGASMLLAALYVFLHSAFRIKNNDRLRDFVSSETAKWSMAGAALTVVGGVLWIVTLPPSGQAALVGAAALNILVSIIFALTAGVIVMLYFGPYKNPTWITPGFALLFFGMGLAATGAGEFIREATRKPYIVYGRVLGNGIRPSEIPELRRTGYLNGGLWTRAHIAKRYPQVMTDGKIDGDKLLSMTLGQRRDVGRTIFQYHCNDCHAVEGYSAVAQLSRGWPRELILETVIHLDETHFFMPPWAGTREEAEVITDFIDHIQHPFPSGMYEQTELREGR